jgi:RNA polymerase sigma-70 factor (ECF subfamily)
MHNPNSYVETDERLETPSKEGTTQAWEQVLSTHLASFHRQAYRLLGNAADAEDAVQDALLAAYSHRDQFRAQSQISTWLTTIVLNCARLQLRRRHRYTHVALDEPIGEIQTLSLSEQLPDQRPNPEDECRKSELSTRLTHFHGQLSPTLHRTFQLRDIDGLSIRETARILGVPIGTVKAQLARARKRLKELMRSALRPRSRSLRDEGLGCGRSAASHRCSGGTHGLSSHGSSRSSGSSGSSYPRSEGTGGLTSHGSFPETNFRAGEEVK